MVEWVQGDPLSPRFRRLHFYGRMSPNSGFGRASRPWSPRAVCRQASVGASQPCIPLTASPCPFARCRREGAGDHDPRCVGHGCVSVRCRPSSPGVCHSVACTSEARSLRGIPAALSGGEWIPHRREGSPGILLPLAAQHGCRGYLQGPGRIRPLSCRRRAKAKQPNMWGTEGQGGRCWWLRQGVA